MRNRTWLAVVAAGASLVALLPLGPSMATEAPGANPAAAGDAVAVSASTPPDMERVLAAVEKHQQNRSAGSGDGAGGISRFEDPAAYVRHLAGRSESQVASGGAGFVERNGSVQYQQMRPSASEVAAALGSSGSRSGRSMRLSGAAAPAVEPSGTHQSVTTASISGTVTAGGTALEGAQVSAVLNETLMASALTDSNGAYTLEIDLSALGQNPGQEWLVRFAANGYATEFFGPAYTTTSTSARRFIINGTEQYTGVGTNMVLASSIAGTISRTDSQPLEGFTVTLVSHQLVREVMSDPTTGEYIFDDLPAADYVLCAAQMSDPAVLERRCWTTDDTPPSPFVTLGAGENRTAVNLALSPAPRGTITGTVTAAGGGAIEGLEVYARSTSWEYFDITNTASDGTYSLLLPPGEYVVGFGFTNETCCSDIGFVYAGEYYVDAARPETATPVTVALGATVSNIDAELNRWGTVSGIVSDDSSNPLEGAQVCFAGALEPSWWESPTCTSTDAEGKWTLVNVWPGWSGIGRRIYASKRGYLRQYLGGSATFDGASTFDVSPGAALTGQNFALADVGGTFLLEGTVKDPDGNAVVGAPVFVGIKKQFSFGDVYFEPVDTTTTDENGRYEFKYLGPGPFIVQVGEDWGYNGFLVSFSTNEFVLSGADALTLDANNATVADFTLAAPSSISGKVSPDGSAQVFACADGQYPLLWTCRSTDSDETGNYTLSVPPGTYRLYYLVSGRAPLYYGGTDVGVTDPDEAALVTVAPNETKGGIDVEVAIGGVISGSVTDGSAAIEGASVYLSGGRGVVTAVTDASGNYRFDGLAAGSYLISASSPTAAVQYWSSTGMTSSPSAADPVVASAGTTTTVDLELAVPGSGSAPSVRGTATAPLGGDVELTLVRAFDASSGSFIDETVQAQLTVVSGVPYAFEGVNPGSYRLCWRAPGVAYDCGEVFAVDSGVTAQDLTLVRSASLRGTAFGPSGLPLSSGIALACRLGSPVHENWWLRFGGCLPSPGEGTDRFSYLRFFTGGTYELLDLPPGEYVVRIFPDERPSLEWVYAGGASSLDDAARFDVGPGEGLNVGSLTLTKCQTGGLSGRVVDEDGGPISGVFVLLRSLDQFGSNCDSAYSAYTDANGYYRASGLSDEPRQLRFRGFPSTSPGVPGKESYRFDPWETASPSLVRVVPGKVTTGFNTRLRNKVLVSGTALEGDGDGNLAGARVCMTSGYDTPHCTVSDASGNWSMKVDPGVTYDAYAVQGDISWDLVSRISRAAAASRVRVGRRDLTGVVVPEIAYGSIAGSISLGGKPAAAGTQILAVSLKSFEVFEPEFVDAKPTSTAYRFSLLPPGKYAVVAYGQNPFIGTVLYESGADDPFVTVTSGGALTGIDLVQLRGSAVRFRVKEATTGNVVASAVVETADRVMLTGANGVTPPVVGSAQSFGMPLRVWRSDRDRRLGADPVFTETYAATPGDTSTRVLEIPVAGTPSAPQNPSASVQPGRISLSWDAPGSTGGSAVVDYEVSVTPPLPDGSGSESSPIITTGRTVELVGALNATRYELRVRARNAVGRGPGSTPVRAIPNGCLGTPFTDVAEDAPYCEDLDWAYSQGLLDVNEGAVYGAEESVRVEEIVDWFNAMRAALYGVASEAPATTPVAPTVRASRLTRAESAGSLDAEPAGLTRAAFAQTMFEFAGSPSKPASTACGGAATGPYDDVPADHPNCRAIEWVKQLGLADSWALANFEPTRAVTRQEATASLFAYQAQGIADAAPLVVAAAPGAPTDVSGLAGVESVTVSWDPPASDGGSSLIGYVATASPGGKSCSATGLTSCAISGLSSEQEYRFTVSAYNVVGAGPSSDLSAPVTPLAPPPGTHTVTVDLQGSGTGSVTSNPAGISCGATCNALFTADSSVMLTPTPRRDAYFAGWTGDCSGTAACSLTVSGPKVATATFGLAVAAVGRPAAVLVSWNAAAWPSLANRTGFEVQRSSNGGATWVRVAVASPSRSTAVVRGLYNGRSYVFRVRAVQGRVKGAWFTTLSVKPRTVPGRPSPILVRGLDGSLEVTWTAPYSGGAPILAYRLQTSTDNRTWSPPVELGPGVRSFILTGLPNGVKRYVRVYAVNIAGSGRPRVSARVAPVGPA